ncbi:MAG TPA: SCO family protein [Pirellulales bacterium]|jgi:protein SCO1/2|nr:SCO family protein [Pirellulales bacterium]
MSFAVRMWLSVLLLAVSGYTAYSGWRMYAMASAAETDSEQQSEALEFNVTPGREPTIRDVENLTFTTSEGRPFELKQLNGKVWLGSFFFSSCPGPCRQINLAIAGLTKELAGKDVKFVSMTVDPDNDTPQVLHDYGKSFEADFGRWYFLTGKFDDARRVCQDVFAMPIERKVHTERLILVDRSGRRRGIYSTSEPAQMRALRKMIDQLLDEKSGAAVDEKGGASSGKDAS